MNSQQVDEQGSIQWLSGDTHCMISTQESNCWLLTHSISDPSQLAMAEHLRLQQGIRLEDAGSVHKCSGRSIRLPSLRGWQLLLALCLGVLCWVALTPLIQPDIEWSGYGDSFRQGLGGFLLTWMSLVLVDALFLQHALNGNASTLMVTWWGPRINSIAWILCKNRLVACTSLLSPVLVLFVSASSSIPPTFGLGMALCAVMILSLRILPISYGPMTSMLARLRGVDDFRKALKLALANMRNKTTMGRRDRSTGLLYLSASVCILSAMAILSGAQFIDDHWMGMGLGSILMILGVNMRSVIRLMVGAWRQRRRGDVHLIVPDFRLKKRWEDNCAMVFHVPKLANLEWSWKNVDKGYTLIQAGQTEGSCYWVASGSLEILGRTAKGDWTGFGVLQSGTAIGAGNLQEFDESAVDVVALENTIVACLDAQIIQALPEESRRRLSSFILMSQYFDKNSILKGIQPVQKELWLAKGRMVWIPGGAVLMEVGEEATWMGLLVQGALQINGKDGSEAQVMKPGDLVGDEILSGALRRKLTLLTTEPTLLLRWEYGWVQQWIPRISSEREYGALEQYLQVQ